MQPAPSTVTARQDAVLVLFAAAGARSEGRLSLAPPLDRPHFRESIPDDHSQLNIRARLSRETERHEFNAS